MKLHGKGKLINDLREEYLKLNHKIGAAKFAVATLPLDGSEKDLLIKQIAHMEKYGETLMERAGYAALKNEEPTSQGLPAYI